MRIVVDTNVFVSGIFFSGPPHRILKAWADGFITLLVSAEILDEYQRVVESLSLDFPAINPTPILELVAARAEVCPARNLAGPVCVDADDDKFFACALSGAGSLIVSGDKHLLQVSGYAGIRVLKPRAFVDEFL